MKEAARTIRRLGALDVSKMRKALNVQVLPEQNDVSKQRRRPPGSCAVLFTFACFFLTLSFLIFRRNSRRSPFDEEAALIDGKIADAGGAEDANVTAGLNDEKSLSRLREFSSSTLPSYPTDYNAPKWCTDLMQHPRPNDKSCVSQRADGRCHDGRTHFFSQYKQDYLLFEKHFKFLTRPGIYADVATNHPILISNTYFFDKCLAWKGFCVEADPSYGEMIVRHRNCRYVPTCVSNKVEKVSYRLDGNLGGVNVTNKNTRFTKTNHYGKPVKMAELECTTLKKLFKESGVKHLDYLSLDVEGHELQVLQGIDWKEVTIDILSVETGPGTPVHEFLMNLGYTVYLPKEIENYPFLKKYESIYLAPDVIMGKVF